MPEGDSVHRTAAALRVLVGERVGAVSLHPRGAVTGVAGAVDGLLLESVEAVGKNLYLQFEGGVVVRSHLRMSGRWRVQPRGSRLTGRPWLVLRGGGWEAVQSNGPVLELARGVRRRVGIDVLGAEVAPAGLVAAVRRADGRRLLGEVLLDQRFVAGIGNMWAAEALWHAGVSPWLPLEQAADDDLARVLGWAREAMQASVAGVVRSPRLVYRRAGRPCPRCGGRIESHGLGDANRIAYWCPHCQRGPSAGGRTA